MDDTIDENWIKLFSQGLAEDQKKYNITLLGGDTVSAPHGLFITINMLSRTNDSIIKRSGACYGDNIYVTGTIGNSAIGLHLLKNKNDYEINFDREYVDIEPFISEIIIDNLDTLYICSNKCKGLCGICGNNMNKIKCSCEEKNLKESPFSSLSQLDL